MELQTKIIGLDNLNNPNHNGRIYSSSQMQDAINKYMKKSDKFCELNPNYGELTHDSEHFYDTKLSNIAGKVNDMSIENNEVFAKIELYDTPKGNVVKNIINTGHDIQLGPRMTGDAEVVYETDENGNKTPKLDENGNVIIEVKNVNIVSLDII